MAATATPRATGSTRGRRSPRSTEWCQSRAMAIPPYRVMADPTCPDGKLVVENTWPMVSTGGRGRPTTRPVNRYVSFSPPMATRRNVGMTHDRVRHAATAIAPTHRVVTVTVPATSAPGPVTASIAGERLAARPSTTSRSSRPIDPSSRFVSTSPKPTPTAVRRPIARAAGTPICRPTAATCSCHRSVRVGRDSVVVRIGGSLPTNVAPRTRPDRPAGWPDQVRVSTTLSAPVSAARAKTS